ncbi:hypothetical protein HDV00_004781 [Rhizophlyctis rosea]|nr:hypothetical protein HDV00_004781 [Rhizophlyctis rosea]
MSTTYVITRDPNIVTNIALISSVISTVVSIVITALLNALRVHVVSTQWWARHRARVSAAIDVVIARGGKLEVARAVFRSRAIVLTVIVFAILVWLAEPMGLVANSAYQVQLLDREVKVNEVATTVGWTNCGDRNSTGAVNNVRCEWWNQVRLEYLAGFDNGQGPENSLSVLDNVTALFQQKYPPNILPVDTTIASTTVSSALLPLNRSDLKPGSNFAFASPQFVFGCSIGALGFSVSINETVALYQGNSSQSDIDAVLERFKTYWRPQMLNRTDTSKPLPFTPITVPIGRTTLNASTPFVGAGNYLLSIPLNTDFAQWWLQSDDFVGSAALPQFRLVSTEVRNLTFPTDGNNIYKVYPPSASLSVALLCTSTAYQQASYVTVREGGVAGVWLDKFYSYQGIDFYAPGTDFQIVAAAELESEINAYARTLFGTSPVEFANTVSKVGFTPIRYLNHVLSAKGLLSLMETRRAVFGRDPVQGILSSQPVGTPTAAIVTTKERIATVVAIFGGVLLMLCAAVVGFVVAARKGGMQAVAQAYGDMWVVGTSMLVPVTGGEVKKGGDGEFQVNESVPVGVVRTNKDRSTSVGTVASDKAREALGPESDYQTVAATEDISPLNVIDGDVERASFMTDQLKVITGVELTLIRRHL